MNQNQILKIEDVYSVDRDQDLTRVHLLCGNASDQRIEETKKKNIQSEEHCDLC